MPGATSNLKEADCGTANDNNFKEDGNNGSVIEKKKMSLYIEKSASFVRGGDATRVTCRGSLQSKRSQLNREIHKEMRLRAGAENLLKATSNRSVKETAQLELSFVNSHIQLLREQLAELNGCLEAYQGQGQDNCIPMIPLGLKETVEIDFREQFKDFILEHYSEDGDKYDDAIQIFMELRQTMRRPSRTKAGVQMLLRYLGTLYFVERRFFPSDRNIGVFFEWYDALTGVPSTQRTVAFEKASVLFNLAALYTQIGSKQHRHIDCELEVAVDNFLRAAGTLRYIGEHFTHPPSFDLAPHILEALTALFLVQARECLFERQESQSEVDKLLEKVEGMDDEIKLLDLAQESQLLSDEYERVHLLLSHAELKECIPPAWSALVQVKKYMYLSVAHHNLATLLLSGRKLCGKTLEAFQFVYLDTDGPTVSEIRVPNTSEETKSLGLSHLRASFSNLEDSKRHARLNKELRSKKGLEHALSNLKDKILSTFEKHKIQNVEELEHVLDPPGIIAGTKFQLEITAPDLSTNNVEDPFKGLGPLSLFSAKRHWTAPRHVTLHKRGDGFGLSVKGNAPVSVASVDDGSPAELAGVRCGDVIVGIGDDDARWLNHEEVVDLVKDASDSLALRLVTPMDSNKSSAIHHTSRGRISPHSTSSNGSIGGMSSSTSPLSSSSNSSGYGGSIGRSSSRHLDAASPGSDSTLKKLTNSLFRRSKSKSREPNGSDLGAFRSNVILR